MAMRSNSGTRDGRTTLLPSGTQDFFEKRGIELAGCALAVLAFALLIACLTYHPQDPSWNDATGGVVRNLLGPFGSYKTGRPACRGRVGTYGATSLAAVQ